MSAGPRIPLEFAERAAGYLISCWGLEGRDAMPVGSVRRRREDIGDLEIACPVEPAHRDELCKLLLSCVEDPDALFKAPDLPAVIPQRGLKPGFLTASIVACVTYDGRPMGLPVQINRWQPGNRGWTILRATGPKDFGAWFLGRWKKQFGIADGQASVDGFLVDEHGVRVPADTEEECFRKCGIGAVRPHMRDEFMERVVQARSGAIR